MVLLIDCTYFTKGERQVQNAPTSPDNCIDQNAIAVRDSINGWIEAEQERFLVSVLGKNTADILQMYLEEKEESREASGAEVEEPFEADDELEFIASGLKESLADYVMYKMFRGTAVHMVNTGAVVLNSANENMVNTARRQASVWNSMTERLKRFIVDADKKVTSYAIKCDRNMVTPVNAMNL